MLSLSDTFISRNVESYKNNKERKSVLEESVKAVMMAKNKDSLEATAANIASDLFQGKEYLSKE